MVLRGSLDTFDHKDGEREGNTGSLNLLDLQPDKIKLRIDSPVECFQKDARLASALALPFQNDTHKQTVRGRRKLPDDAAPLGERLHYAGASGFAGEATEQYAREGVEPIYRDVAPQRHLVLRGETTQGIARRHLGQGATADEIKRHVSEIEQLNQIQPGKLPKTGDTIILPGHTKDGDAVFKDYFGTTMKLSPDGKTTVQYKDGTGYTRTFTAPGEHTDKHFGSRETDNFEVKFKADGTFERVNPAKPVQRDLAEERAKLEKAIDTRSTRPHELKTFKQQMTVFEERAKKQNLSDAEVAETYAQISRILAGADGAPLNERQRVRTAVGVMDVAAQPRMNDQGGKNTCNVTVVQNRLFTRQPSEAAKLVADIATTGKYVAADGTTVFIDKGSLAARGEEASNERPGTNNRSYASQIFQVTAANLAHVKNNEATAPMDELRYEQRASTDNNDSDSGERLMDYSTGRAVERTREPNLTDNQIQQVYNQISGKNETGFFLDNKRSNGPGASKTNLFSSPAELEEKLKQLAADGQLPAIIGVYTSNKPFGSDSDQPSKEMLFDGHVVLSVDYDPKTRKVSVDNQWGTESDFLCDKGKDNRLTIDTLYKATLHMPANEWLDRIESKKAKLGPRAYLNQIARTMGSYEGMWKDQESLTSEYGEVDQADRDRARIRYEALLFKLPHADRAYLKSKVEQAKKEFLESPNR